MAVAFPARLETARLLLRETCAADAGAVFAGYAADPEVTRFLTFRPHRSVADSEAFLAWAAAQRAGGGYNCYAIIRRADGALMGTFDLRRETEYRVTCGYALGRAYWRQGYMSEALRAAVEWVAGQPEIQRFWTFCDVENTGSWRVMEKAGMLREGVMRAWNRPVNLGVARDCLAYVWVRGMAPEA